MATCAECVHVEVCRYYTNELAKANGIPLKLEEVERLLECDDCENFKDRARFVELPCKVGDTIYWNLLGKPVEDEIVSITIYKNVIRVFLKKGISFDIEDIGRMLFLSREEAEQELTEREA